jgi:ATPase subunit of ABC transporter with duplicated ATPase domains
MPGKTLESRGRCILRVASIRQQRQADLVSKREKKEAKEQRERAKKEELTEKLQEIGGLWKTPDEVDRKVKALSGDKKVKALQVQIMFRRHVLGTQNTGKIMNVPQCTRNTTYKKYKNH